jgi:hypothetical protein
MLYCLDAKLRQYAGQKMTRGYADRVRVSTLGYSPHLVVVLNSLPDVPADYLIAVSSQTVGEFRDAISYPTVINRAASLQKRLGGVVWPSPGVWLDFMNVLRGEVDTPTNLPTIPWNTIFPTVFPIRVDMSKWEAEVGEVLEVFARDRRITRKVVEKVFQVKV